MKKKIGKICLAVFLLFLLLLGIGFSIEQIRGDAVSKYPPAGSFIDYEGSELHYFKSGSGDRTVVFSSGNGTSSPYIDMYHLQNEISNYAETIVYERLGYGWSEPTNRERTIENMTDEMEAVLSEAGSNHTFIFVGHSMAALEIIHYAQRYPERVDGIVLIDGVHPAYTSEMENLVPMSINVMRFINSTGVLRLLSNFDFMKQNLVQNKDLPENLHDLALDFALDRMWNETMLAERRALNANGQKVNEGDALENIPFIIFSATENPMEDWKQSQEALPSWSNLSEQIWVDTANHFIHLEQPELIVDKIQELLEE